ncbi:cation diffusion facilitator family transporter [Reinekea marina]|uniref:Cation diffusion facilitator family transporter n=1 Tax=Reinekea marina TaxID=1310421 RepID=A0ABV7WX37_9GAMM|nr:cation diffusion facilitator family transporter [Reinekea marina]MDN3648774.1 cation diffusion facilitator family transporter [Reinekea marina]
MHDHPNGHHHDHHHPVPDSGSAIAWAFFLNFGFTLIEFIGGYLTNSTAIMADAIHDLGDSLAIGLTWILNKVSKKPQNEVYSFGYRRFTLLGSIINGIILIVGSIWILTESIPRLLNPEMPVVEGMIGLAILGTLVNGFAAYKLSGGKTLADRMLNLHLLEDVLGWVAVLVVAIILYFFDWPILDPILSIGFTLFILLNVTKTLYKTIRVFLQATPSADDYRALKEALKALPNIEDVHHLHIWSLDGARNVLSAHVVINASIGTERQQRLKDSIQQCISDYDFEHTTIELEFAEQGCRDST